MKHIVRFVALVCCSLVTALPLSAEITTGWIQTGAGQYDYNDTANWAGGVINGVFSEDLVLTANQTITFDRDTTLDGLQIKYAGKFSLTFVSSAKDEYDTPRSAELTLRGNIVMDTVENDAAVTVYFGSSSVATDNLVLNLGDAVRTISSADSKTVIRLLAKVTRGGLNLKNSGTVLFNDTSNDYSMGTMLNGSGPVNIMQNSFGVGPVEFNEGSSLVTSGNRTFTNNNKLVFNADVYFNGGGGNLNLGAGDIVINAPVSISISKNTLTLGGQVAADSPYGIDGISLANNGGTLSTFADLEVVGEVELNAEKQWDFRGVISGSGRIVKTGGGEMDLFAQNTFEGKFVIRGGKVRFRNTPIFPSLSEMFLVESGGELRANSASEAGYLTAPRMLYMIDKASTGALGFDSGASDAIDLTDYPGLRLVTSGGVISYTGNITAPSSGVLKIGGGGNTLKIGGTITGATEIDTSTGHIQFDASQPDFTGKIVSTNRSYSVTVGNGVTLPNASIEKTGGSVVFAAGTTGDFTTFASVKLNAAQIQLSAPTAGSVTRRIGTLTIGTDLLHPSGGTAHVNLANSTANDSVLYVDTIAFENNAELLHVINTATGEGAARMFVANGLQAKGTGELNTIFAPVLPNVRANSEIATYDPVVGIRSLNENEFTLYEAGYSGPVKNNGENAKLVGAGSVLFTENGSVNSLWAVNDSSGNLVVSSAEGVTVGVGSGAIVVNSYSNEKYVNLAMRLDFGSKRGYFFGRSNVFYNLTGAIAGSSGLTICDGNTTTSANGPNLYATNTYHGATYITCLVYPKTADFLANGTARPGNLCLTGTLSFGSNAYARMNGLDGYGSITSNNKDGWIQLGCDNSDGNYRGGFVNNASGANFTFTKLGTGHQRMETKIGEKWSINITGTLQVDGAVAIDRSGYEIYVNDGGVLAGEGTFKGYSKTVVKSGGIIAPGSPEVPNVPMTFTKTLEMQTGASMKFYIGADRASQAIVAEGYGITGTATTIPVTVDCTVKKKGAWLLLEADTFNEKVFSFTTRPSGGRLVVKTDETTNRAQLWYEQTSGLYMAIR